MSDRDEQGRFQRGNKVATGRPKSARGRYEIAVEMWEQLGFNPLQAAAVIATGRDPEATPEMRIKALKIASDAELKVLSAEKEPELANKPIEVINKELCERLSQLRHDDIGLLPFAMMTPEQLDYLGREHTFPFATVKNALNGDV